MRADSTPWRSTLIQAATDDAEAQLVLVEAIDGRIGDGAQTLERVVLVVSHTRRIAEEQREKDEGTRRQLGQPAPASGRRTGR